ncbi:hypothetical protein GQ602_003851 [Ophiocordyceps camponoti-floridani]|uniref:Uncharacterized protein n=1 Tax=Ophiocordyceps camponoti-floridani TaxID=2030778 RepID=A0A8H4Q5N3_9HYPO|nr:hypothetical protein GQ602_003851 [Ophiocordyceps camponoti-floridani]
MCSSCATFYLCRFCNARVIISTSSPDPCIVALQLNPRRPVLGSDWLDVSRRLFIPRRPSYGLMVKSITEFEGQQGRQSNPISKQQNVTTHHHPPRNHPRKRQAGTTLPRQNSILTEQHSNKLESEQQLQLQLQHRHRQRQHRQQDALAATVRAAVEAETGGEGLFRGAGLVAEDIWVGGLGFGLGAGVEAGRLLDDWGRVKACRSD